MERILEQMTLSDPLMIAVLSIGELCILSLYLFVVCIVIRVILSFVSPHGYHPMLALAGAMAEPVVRPLRRLLPTIGGIDFSPYLTIVLLIATVIYVRSLMPIQI